MIILASGKSLFSYPKGRGCNAWSKWNSGWCAAIKSSGCGRCGWQGHWSSSTSLPPPPLRSGGVERVSSQLLARDRTTTLKKSAKDTTLEHSLFAAFNTG